MTDTTQLPPLPTPKFTETIRGVPCITVTEHEHLMRTYALQAIALRPVQVSMDKQDAWDNSPVNSDWEAVDAYLQGIEDAESHHGITAQTKKETP
jgi:hypothetical protein